MVAWTFNVFIIFLPHLSYSAGLEPVAPPVLRLHFVKHRNAAVLD